MPWLAVVLRTPQFDPDLSETAGCKSSQSVILLQIPLLWPRRACRELRVTEGRRVIASCYKREGFDLCRFVSQGSVPSSPTLTESFVPHWIKAVIMTIPDEVGKHGLLISLSRIVFTGASTSSCLQTSVSCRRGVLRRLTGFRRHHRVRRRIMWLCGCRPFGQSRPQAPGVRTTIL